MVRNQSWPDTKLDVVSGMAFRFRGDAQSRKCQCNRGNDEYLLHNCYDVHVDGDDGDDVRDDALGSLPPSSVVVVVRAVVPLRRRYALDTDRWDDDGRDDDGRFLQRNVVVGLGQTLAEWEMD